MSRVVVYYPPSLIVMDVPSLIAFSAGVGLLTAAMRKRFMWHTKTYYILTTLSGVLLVASSCLSSLHKMISASTRYNVRLLYDQLLVMQAIAFLILTWAALLFIADLRIHTYRGMVLGPKGEVPAGVRRSTDVAPRSGVSADDVELQPLFVDDDDDEDGDDDGDDGNDGNHDGGAGADTASGGSGSGTDRRRGSGAHVVRHAVMVTTSDNGGSDGGGGGSVKRAKKIAKRIAKRRKRHRRSPLVVFSVPLVALACMGIVTMAMWYDAGSWGMGPAVAWDFVAAITSVLFAATMATACYRCGWRDCAMAFASTSVVVGLMHLVHAFTHYVWYRELFQTSFHISWAVSTFLFWRSSRQPVHVTAPPVSVLDIRLPKWASSTHTRRKRRRPPSTSSASPTHSDGTRSTGTSTSRPPLPLIATSGGSQGTRASTTAI